MEEVEEGGFLTTVGDGSGGGVVMGKVLVMVVVVVMGKVIVMVVVVVMGKVLVVG